MSSKKDIESFLNTVKSAIDQKNYTPVDRDKNLQTLADLNMSWKDAIEEIKSLTAEHYFRGPSPDRDRPGSEPLWEFKKRVLSEKVYIKLKVMYRKDRRLLIVSFHIDEN